MSFILSVLFYLYLSAIVAAHNKHRKVLPYIGSETKHIYKEGEGFFSRVMFGKKKGEGRMVVAMGVVVMVMGSITFRRRLLILTTLVITTSTIERIWSWS